MRTVFTLKVAELSIFVKKRLDGDFFIIKRKTDESGGAATYYKAKVASLAGLERHEIIHFG